MESLETLRKKIDEIDEEIMERLLKRMDLSKEVKIFKENNNVPVLDSKREEEIFRKISLKGENSFFLEEIYKKIIFLSKEIQSHQ